MLQQLPVQVRDGSGDRIDQEAASTGKCANWGRRQTESDCTVAGVAQSDHWAPPSASGTTMSTRCPTLAGPSHLLTHTY